MRYNKHIGAHTAFLFLLLLGLLIVKEAVKFMRAGLNNLTLWGFLLAIFGLLMLLMGVVSLVSAKSLFTLL